MTILVVMGVSGSGKTTVGQELAARLGWPYAEADDFHPQANIDKMAAGHPLSDDDRWPWLSAIAEWIDGRREAGGHGVVTCSALKRSYRDVLRRPDVTFVHLTGDRDLLASRIGHRKGHYMPAALLGSQFADLEPPTADERSVAVDVAPSPAEIVADALAQLGLGLP